MLDVILQAMVYVAFIALGFLLRKTNFLGPEAFPVISKIVIKVTLPCALFSTFLNREIDTSMLLIVGLGFGTNALLLLAANLLHLRKSTGERAFAVLNVGTFNVGTFTMPFLQTFFGGGAVAVAGLFEVGNGFYSTGGSLTMAQMIRDKQGFSPLRILKGLLHSIPFLANVAGICVAYFHIPVPGPFAEFTTIVGSANAFLAMFALGVGFHLETDREHMGKLIKILGMRYAVCAALAAFFFTCLPFDLMIRKTLVLLCFGPLSSPIPAYAEELKMDSGLASAINSISVLFSTVMMVVLLTAMG